MVSFDDLDTDLNTVVTKEQLKAEEIKKNAHIANGGEATFNCPACNGSGNFVSYSGRIVGSCFKCKGKGKVSKRVLGAAKAKVTRQQNLENKINEFVEENEELYRFIVKNREWSDFYRSMFDSIQTYGRLTEGQMNAVKRGIEKAEAKRAEKAAEREKLGGEVDISAIDRLFEGARENGLKKLAFRAEGMKISAARENSRNPGALYVEHEGVYAGKIVNGKFIPAYAAKENTLERIAEIAANPLEAARFYGRQTGVCSCCGRELTDPTSVANGIGPICESNWGF